MTRRILIVCAVLTALIASFVMTSTTGRSSVDDVCEFDTSLKNALPGFEPRRVLTSSVGPITDFETSSVEAALADIRPNELVLAVNVGAEHRAYPINMLTGPSREIINDTLAGRAIAATW